MKLPNEYKVGGQRVEVQTPDCMNGVLGQCDVSAGWIKVARFYDEKPISESSRTNTFYHEVIHSILDTMGRNDLNTDEVFVCSFASFLTEVLTSMKPTAEEIYAKDARILLPHLLEKHFDCPKDKVEAFIEEFVSYLFA